MNDYRRNDYREDKEDYRNSDYDGGSFDYGFVILVIVLAGCAVGLGRLVFGFFN